MKPKIHFARLRAVFAVIGAIFVLFFAATASTEAYNAYEGCKVPLLDIPVEISCSYQHLEALGSKMAYIETSEDDPILFFSRAAGVLVFAAQNRASLGKLRACHRAKQHPLW